MKGTLIENKKLPDWKHPWEPTGHKITKVEWIPFTTHLTGPYSQKCYIIVRLTTDKGAQGHSIFNRHYNKSDEAAALLIGLDPGDPEAIVIDLQNKGFSHRAYTPIDVALWDLMGKIRGKPMHEMLGTKQDKIKAKGGVQFDNKTPEGIQKGLEDLRREVSYGFSVVHFHIHLDNIGQSTTNFTEAGLENDIETFRLMRQAAPDTELIADCHNTYTVAQAVRVGKVLEELKYRHFESPMPEHNSWMEQYVELQKQLKIPVSAPEIFVDDTNWGGPFKSILRWLAAGAMKTARPSNKLYGFTETLWISRLVAQREGMRCEIHNDADFTYFYNLQILATLDEKHSGIMGYFSLPPKETYIPPWLKTPVEYIENLYGPEPKNLYIPVPKTPGLGVEVNWEYVNKNGCAETVYESR